MQQELLIISKKGNYRYARQVQYQRIDQSVYSTILTDHIFLN